MEIKQYIYTKLLCKRQNSLHFPEEIYICVGSIYTIYIYYIYTHCIYTCIHVYIHVLLYIYYTYSIYICMCIVYIVYIYILCIESVYICIYIIYRSKYIQYIYVYICNTSNLASLNGKRKLFLIKALQQALWDTVG